MDINKLKPILSNGIAPILKGAFGTFSFPFGETVVFMMVFSNIAKVKGLFVGGGLIILSTLRNILVLGS